MITFTKEQLIASAHARIEFAEMMLAGDLEPLKERTWSIELELARIALASLEAEPVAWLLSGGGAKNHVSFDSGNAYADPLREVTPLYTAPPAPVSVPAAMEMDDDFDSAFEHGKAVGWNACRAALLQAGNSPVTPDGYVLVPKELTCEMDDAAWGAYHETRCMSDIWAALLAAAPKQEVKAALEHGMQRYPELCKNCQKGISDG